MHGTINRNLNILADSSLSLIKYKIQFLVEFRFTHFQFYVRIAIRDAERHLANKLYFKSLEIFWFRILFTHERHRKARGIHQEHFEIKGYSLLFN